MVNTTKFKRDNIKQTLLIVADEILVERHDRPSHEISWNMDEKYLCQ